jgi:hypothetical protein
MHGLRISAMGFLIGLATALPAVAADSAVASIKSVYEKSLQKIEQDAAADMAARSGQYVRLLEQAMKALQANGDLDGLLAIRKEKERFELQKKVPENPPPDTPAQVAKIQADYRKLVADAEVAKNRQIVTLTDTYIGKLDGLKKDFTMLGKMDDAIQLKGEVDKALSSAVYTAAKFALADQETKSVAKTTPDPAPSAGTAAKMMACFRCNGTGKIVQSSCNACSGTGRCSVCDGRGQKRSGLKGSSGMVGCNTCRATGKCRTCNGSGSTTSAEPCPTCNGTGKIPEPDRPAGREPPTLVTPRPQPQPPITRPPVPVDNRDLDDYAATVTKLKKAYEERRSEEADFDEVIHSQKAFKGKLLRSKVYIVDARPRNVRVAGNLEDAKRNGQLLIPSCVDVGNKAEAVRMEIRPKDPVVITYGVVNEDNLTLFDIGKAP